MAGHIRDLLPVAVAVRGLVQSVLEGIAGGESGLIAVAAIAESCCGVQPPGLHSAHIVGQPHIGVVCTRGGDNLVLENIVESVRLQLRLPYSGESPVPLQPHIAQPGILGLEFGIAVAGIIELVEIRHAVCPAAEGHRIQPLKNRQPEACGRGEDIAGEAVAVEPAVILEGEVGLEPPEAESRSGGRADCRPLGIIDVGIQPVVLHSRGCGDHPPRREAETVRRVELKLLLEVVAVAPAALVFQTVKGGLGAEIEGVERGEGLVQRALDECVAVILPVFRWPAHGTRRASPRAVEIGFRLPLAAAELAEQVDSASHAADVVVLPGLPVAVREIALAAHGGEIGSEYKTLA